MKNAVLALMMMCILTGCKKFIEQQKENLVWAVMTQGQWSITRFVEAGDTITTQFSPYSFQFNRDYTVDAIRGGAVESKGTWEADPETMNITASFSSANETITRINGTWHIYQKSTSYVMADQSGAIEKSLRLDKLP
ncbi:MAG: hypothetical protein DI535_12000 [Citrobacter freundii]|nr:MAG: hypothetical protein DI535_12000 [Citrobacter freundii]